MRIYELPFYKEHPIATRITSALSVRCPGHNISLFISTIGLGYWHDHSGYVASYRHPIVSSGFRSSTPIHGQPIEFRVFWVISLNKLLVLYRSQYMRAFQLIVSTLLWAYLLASQFYERTYDWSKMRMLAWAPNLTHEVVVNQSILHLDAQYLFWSLRLLSGHLHQRCVCSSYLFKG